MSGMNDIWKIKRFAEQCERMGFKAGASSRHYNERFGDTVALLPSNGESFPIYSRDAELFVGTIEQALTWMHGIEWGQNYYKMIKATTDKQVARKEQDWRNQNLLDILKGKNE